MPPFQRPSRPRPELLDDAVSSLKGKERKHDDLSQDRNMTLSSLEDDDCVDPGISDYGEGVVAHEYVPLEDRNLRKVAYTPTRKNIVPAREYKGQHEAAAIKGNQINQLDDANKSPPVTDDASDVMNPLIDGGEGLVIPRIKGVQSMDPEELNDLMEAMFESFAANPSVQDTPFAKTLNYFKQFKDKENSPSKSRRNASLPEEIAELAKEAQQEGVEDEKAVWDKYREIDLAPMDPIIDDGSDVDSIMGTPVRKTTNVAENSETNDRTRAVSIRPKTRDLPGDGKSNEQASAPLGLNAKVIEGYANETGPMYLVDIPGHFGDAFHLQFRTRASVELITVFLRKRGEALDASKDDIDRLVESFRECPGSFKIRDPSGPASSSSENGDYDQTLDDYAHEKQMILYQEDPVFVKIIGMLPEAAFWVVAQPIAHYSGRLLDAASKTFDAALQKLTGLSLDETPASE
ncbi:hypothetical protein SLS60_005295 [Paraconiothyrium brasiliense]|uniref:Uncharacterized protein n=1 Tax=Paraconiothyrium brasiliense TaxID=300254 RepID=A0ABR3RH07_9PLEO